MPSRECPPINLFLAGRSTSTAPFETFTWSRNVHYLHRWRSRTKKKPLRLRGNPSKSFINLNFMKNFLLVSMKD